jgi:hypothetical protein
MSPEAHTSFRNVKVPQSLIAYRMGFRAESFANWRYLSSTCTMRRLMHIVAFNIPRAS